MIDGEGGVLITRALIASGRSPKGGWTKRQLAILGVEWPPRKGWQVRLCSDWKRLTPEEAALFVSLKG